MDPLRSALRSLRTHVAFSALIITLLALGIGANTAIFGVVHAVLLKPLPYPEPGELVLARKVAPPGADGAMPGGGDMMPDNEFLAWTAAAPKSFRSLAAYRNTSANLQRGEGAVRVPSAAVTGEFFGLLGVTPWRGRLFSADDLKTGAAPTTILSYSAWQSYFGGADSALGQVVKLDDVACTIIGILPPSFEFVDPVQFWSPLPIAPNAPGQMRIQLVRVFGRLAPGATRATAQQELDVIGRAYWANLFSGRGPAPRLPFGEATAQLVPLQEQLARQSRTMLWLLLGAVAFVLLIASTNIANLQLVRAAARRREVAIRAALGATPRQLTLGLLAENLLLAFAGGALGLLLAWWGTQALQSALADTLPRVNPIGLSAPVLGFALLITFVSGLGFGLAPAIRGARIDLLETLKDGGHQSSAGGARWRQGLVALEVALALVLAIDTGLLVKSIYQLTSAELGHRTEDVLTANLSLPRRYGTPAQQREFATRWLAALQSLPGVKAAAITDLPPLAGYRMMVATANLPGATGNINATVNAQPSTMAVASATPDFFRAAGIALKQGRFFAATDGAGAPEVAIVNETFVRRFYPDGFTLGTPINLPPLPGSHGAPATAAVVGVVADVRPRGFDSSPEPLAYFPFEQQPRARVSAVLQFEGDAATLTRAVTGATHKLDSDLALDQPQTLEQQLARQTAPRRVTLILTGTFAATAVLLAALGIFGVMSFTIAQRTQEIGVRMALGATAAAIMGWLFRYAGTAIAVGVVVGLALAAATHRLIASLLYATDAFDPLVFGGGVLALIAVALLACLWPAARAARINPVEALRNA